MQSEIHKTTPQRHVKQTIPNLPTPVKVDVLNKYLDGYHDKDYLIQGFTHGSTLILMDQKFLSQQKILILLSIILTSFKTK